MRSSRALLSLIACLSLCACELVADFDRGKLDAGKPPDAGLGPVLTDPTDDDGLDAGEADAATDAASAE